MFVQCRQDRGGVARVDYRGVDTVMDQPEIIILERRDGQDTQILMRFITDAVRQMGHGFAKEVVMDSAASEKSIIALDEWLLSPAGA